ncbi:MAG: ATP-binding cassette domain-containing protein [Desulfovermiculus sp.]|nr:ATP-binding cassette domain-containing protein [Desulfovermiculus sp.]
MLHLQNLSKRREHAGSVFELYVPSLDVKPGQLVTLVGDSGCGKSTLLDMLALVMQPTQAEVFTLCFGGPDSADFDVLASWVHAADSELARMRREHMGYILQTGGLLPFLTVGDNLCLPARIKGLQDPTDHVLSLAERLGIAQCLTRKPSALSIGQRQRAAIVRAMAHHPDLVLADEPTASVDKARARQIIEDLQAVTREQNTAVVLVTHDPDLVTDADATYGFDLEQTAGGEVQARCRRVA